MIWTMPRPLVQAAGGLLALTAAGSFTMGVINAPERGRLPGERPPGAAKTAAAPIVATEATPLAQERIEAAPPPPPKEEKPDEAKTEEAAADQADQPTLPVPPKAANATQPQPIGQVPTDENSTAPLPEEEPPH
jgi:hypothetical protein